MEFREKKQMRKVLYSPFIRVVLIVFIFFAASATWGVYTKYKDTKGNRDVATKKYNELEKRKDFLESEITRLETKRGKEEEIRKMFGLAKKGEKVVIILDSSQENDISASTLESTKKNTWKQFLNLFRF